MTVKAIQAADTHPLRLLVLRPGGTPKDCDFPNDTAPETFHLGVFEKDQLICVGSFYAEKRSRLAGRKHFRLRGMATHPDLRRKGAGTELMNAALEQLRALQADRLWCNARLRAVPFYERLGLVTEGPEFDIPGIGEHFLMHREIGV